METGANTRPMWCAGSNIIFNTVNKQHILLTFKSISRQLGFEGGYPTVDSQFGEVPGPFSMYSVVCTGREEHIQECSLSQESRQ